VLKGCSLVSLELVSLVGLLLCCELVLPQLCRAVALA
jgi:hypothetical protein